MVKSHDFIKIIHLSFFSLSFSFFSSQSFAQSTKPVFNQQQCVQGLVKKGLKSEDASVWCNYKQECLVRSQKEGLPLEAAKSVCDCSINEFRNQYKTDKFKEMTRQANSNSKISRELREVGESCFANILFE